MVIFIFFAGLFGDFDMVVVDGGGAGVSVAMTRMVRVAGRARLAAYKRRIKGREKRLVELIRFAT